MNTRNEYRKKANDCVSQAKLICNSGDRAALLSIAQFYMKLADRLGERYERGTEPRRRARAERQLGRLVRWFRTWCGLPCGRRARA